MEGIKTVDELIDAGYVAYGLFVNTDEMFQKYPEAKIVADDILKQMSGQVNPSGVLGVFYIPKAQKVGNHDWILALDAVRDPGNLGTIIRLCDWFGIEDLVCSEDTVDCFNPKVLQATMGSIARVNITYLDLGEFLHETSLPVYGAFMEGKSIYQMILPKKGILVMGNEANGISMEIEKCIMEKVSIPQFGNQTAESLNVATATAILLNEIRRG
nr:RNA methyltransferase [[Muricauda] meishanensis]